MSSDLNVDAASYTWKKLDVADKKSKEMIDEYLLFEGKFDGFELDDGKVFK